MLDTRFLLRGDQHGAGADFGPVGSVRTPTSRRVLLPKVPCIGHKTVPGITLKKITACPDGGIPPEQSRWVIKSLHHGRGHIHRVFSQGKVGGISGGLVSEAASARLISAMLISARAISARAYIC